MHDLEPEFYQTHAEFCGVFSNANRLKLLDLLAGGEEYTVSELETASDIAQSNVSQHLKLMRDKGIVSRRRDGVKNYYSLTDERILEAMETMREILIEREEA